MTSLTRLLAALVRLLALYVLLRFVTAFTYTLTNILPQTIGDNKSLETSQNYLQILCITGGIALLLFLAAPLIAKVLVGGKDPSIHAPLNGTLILCTGALIAAIGFSQLAHKLRAVIEDYVSDGVLTDETQAIVLDLAPSFILLLAGALFIAKFHHIGSWVNKRMQSQQDTSAS